jgi:hypothetical protein
MRKIKHLLISSLFILCSNLYSQTTDLTPTALSYFLNQKLDDFGIVEIYDLLKYQEDEEIELLTLLLDKKGLPNRYSGNNEFSFFDNVKKRNIVLGGNKYSRYYLKIENLSKSNFNDYVLLITNYSGFKKVASGFETKDYNYNYKGFSKTYELIQTVNNKLFSIKTFDCDKENLNSIEFRISSKSK